MEVEDGGVELVRSASFGRKRVALSGACTRFGYSEDCILMPPLKRQCSLDAGKSPLEDLPREILIRILCGVEHDDLKRLLFVSKAMKDATLVAKQSHFAYSTPRKSLDFPKAEDLRNSGEFAAPNAPKASRVLHIRRSRLTPTKLSISVALFASDDEDGWVGAEMEEETD